jgi:hypothetical protein
MALADIYMLSMFQRSTLTNEEILNNFFFKRATSAGSASDLIVAFENAGYMQDAWAACQDADIETTLKRAISLGSLTDFAESVTHYPGTWPHDSLLPLHDALNFTLRLDTRAVRPGSKRLCGLAENVVSNGVVTNTDYITSMNLLVTQLGTPQVGDDDTYAPVVVKRILRAPDETHTRARYTLPKTDGELVYGSVTGVLVNIQVSHQTSRGNGR